MKPVLGVRTPAINILKTSNIRPAAALSLRAQHQAELGFNHIDLQSSSLVGDKFGRLKGPPAHRGGLPRFMGWNWVNIRLNGMGGQEGLEFYPGPWLISALEENPSHG